MPGMAPGTSREEGRALDLKGLAEQFVKFGAVGAAATVIDYGILMLLSQVAGWNPLPASVVSFLISLAFNYVASMRYVFTRRDDISRRREAVMFAALSMVGLVLNSILIWACTEVLGHGPIDVTLAKLVANIVVGIWNFTSRKHWLDAD